MTEEKLCEHGQSPSNDKSATWWCLKNATLWCVMQQLPGWLGKYIGSSYYIIHIMIPQDLGFQSLVMPQNSTEGLQSWPYMNEELPIDLLLDTPGVYTLAMVVVLVGQLIWYFQMFNIKCPIITYGSHYDIKCLKKCSQPCLLASQTSTVAQKCLINLIFVACLLSHT